MKTQVTKSRIRPRLMAALTAGAMTLTALWGYAPEAHAGRRGGPSITEETVNARRTDVYTLTLTGREWTTIELEGDGDTDLDLVVRDSNGRVVASDLGRSDSADVSFYVPYTATYRIEVINHGSVYNDYVLCTN